MNGQLEIALLFKNWQRASNISIVLREFGVNAQIFESLEDLWLATSRENLSLVIIDTALVESSETQFLTHPKIKSQELPIAYYQSLSSVGRKFLDQVTENSYCLGIIRDDIPDRIQIKSILLQLTKSKIETIQIEEFERKNLQSAEKINKLWLNLNKCKEFIEGQELVEDIIATLRNLQPSSHNFLPKMFEVLQSKINIVRSSCYALSQYENSVYSPMLEMFHYKDLPRLKFLKEEMSQGMNGSIQEQIYDVAREYLGENIVCLNLLGNKKFPDMVVFLNCYNDLSSETINNLQNRINEQYQLSLLRASEEQSQKKISVWKMLEVLKNIEPNQDWRFIYCDLSLVVSSVVSKTSPFSWETYYSALMEKITLMLGENVIVVENGTSGFFLIVDNSIRYKKMVEIEFLLNSIDLAHYFIDSNIHLTDEDKIKLSFVTDIRSLNKLEQGNLLVNSQSKASTHSYKINTDRLNITSYEV